MGKVTEIIQVINVLWNEFDFNQKNKDFTKNWQSINRQLIKYPWHYNGQSADLLDEIIEKQADQKQDNDSLASSLKLQIELDFVVIWLRAKINLVFCSFAFLYQFLIGNEILMFSCGEWFVINILSISTIQLIKRRQVQMALNIEQLVIIVVAWFLLCKLQDDVTDNFQVQLSMTVYIFNWILSYLPKQFRKHSIIMQRYGLQQSTSLGNLTYLLIILVVVKLPFQLVIGILMTTLSLFLGDYFQSAYIIKLIDSNLETYQHIQHNNHFIVGIVHDLRGPVSCIKMFLETLEIQIPEIHLTDMLRKSINSCQRSSANVYQMISNILDLSKLKSNKFEVVRRTENIDQIVKDAVDLHQTKVEQKGIQIKVYRSPENNFPSQMELDSCRTSQILINLIANAVKFSQQGDIKLVITWKEDQSQTNVSDQIDFSNQIPWYQSEKVVYKLQKEEPIEELIEQIEEQDSFIESEQQIDILSMSDNSIIIAQQSSEESKVQQNNQSEEQKKQLFTEQKPLIQQKSFMGSWQAESNKKGRQASFAFSESMQTPNISSVLDEEDMQDEPQSQLSLIDLANMLNKPKLEDVVVQSKQLEKVIEDADSDMESSQSIVEHTQQKNCEEQINLVSRSVIPSYKAAELNICLLRQSSLPITSDQKRIFVELDKDLKQESIHKTDDVQATIKQVEQLQPVNNQVNQGSELVQNQSQNAEVQVNQDHILKIEIANNMGETGSNQYDCCSEKKSVEAVVVNRNDNQEEGKVQQLNIAPLSFSEISFAQVSGMDQSINGMLDYLEFKDNDNQFQQKNSDKKSFILSLNSSSNKSGSLFGSYSIVNAQQPLVQNQEGSQVQSSKELKVFKLSDLYNQNQEESKKNQELNKQAENSIDFEPPKVESAQQQQSKESHTEALQRFRQDQLAGRQNNQPRRQSLSGQEDINYTPKTIKVRHPLRARSKSITLPNFQQAESKSFPISRLNNYDPTLKKHRGSIVSMQSNLESVDENDESDYLDSPSRKIEKSNSGQLDRQGLVNQIQNKKPEAKSQQKMQKKVEISQPKQQEQKQKVVQINSIMNFGHGRRNNLVKVAEEISMRSRAKSVVIINQELHLKRLKELQKKQSIPNSLQSNMNQNSVISDKNTYLDLQEQEISNQAQMLNSSMSQTVNSGSNSSSSNRDKPKSVFAESYSFTAEVAKASKLDKVIGQTPFVRRSRNSAVTLLGNPNHNFGASQKQQSQNNFTFVGLSTNQQVEEQDGWKKGTLIIDVIDNGIGISSEEQKQLFKPFNQANSSVDKEFGGTGLGLWISREMSLLMKGDLKLSSKGKGQGSTFTLSIPTRARVMDQAQNLLTSVLSDHQTELQRALSSDNLPTYSFSKNYQVLVISDDVTYQALSSQFRIYHRTTVVSKITSLANTPKVEDTSYLIFFDANTDKGLIDNIKLFKSQNQISKTQVILVAMMLSNEQRNTNSNNNGQSSYKIANKAKKASDLIDFNVFKLDMKNEIKQIIRLVYGPANTIQKAQSLSDISSIPPIQQKTVAGVQKQVNQKENQLSNKVKQTEKLPDLSKVSQNKKVVQQGSFKSQSSNDSVKKKPRVSSSNKDLICLINKRIVISIEDHVNKILLTQRHFTPYEKVPSASNTFMIVDDDDFVRMSTQQSFLFQTQVFLNQYLNQKLQIGSCLGESSAETLKKFSIKPLYNVEATSGEEAIKIFQSLIARKCYIQLILMDINMGKDKLKGFDAAAVIRNLEKEMLKTDPQYTQVVIVGHSGNDAQTLIKTKRVSTYMNACKDKPLDLNITRKLVSAFSSVYKDESIRSRKIQQALTEQVQKNEEMI